MSLKAYSVNDYDRERGCVVFAETPGKARAEGAGEIANEFIEVEVRRAPEFDGLTPEELTPRVYIERGWRYSCAHCHGWCHQDDGCVFNEAGRVFCDEECRDAVR